MNLPPRHPVASFLEALRARRQVLVRFYSSEDNALITRVCAPLDYGPSRRAKDKAPRYHFWDFSSDVKSHTLGLKPNQIASIEPIDQLFDPAQFVTWKPAWFLPRDWGPFS